MTSFFVDFASELKRLSDGEQCESYLRECRAKGDLEQYFPELAELWGPDGAQDLHHHPEGDSWEHTMLVVRGLQPEHSLTVRLAAIFHDIGKPWTIRRWHEGGISNYGHAAVGARFFRRFIAPRLGLDREEVEQISCVIHYHMLMHRDPVEYLDQPTVEAVLKLAPIAELIELQHIDALGSGAALEKRLARSKREKWLQLLRS